MWLGTVWQTISSDEYLIRLPVAFAGRFGAPMTNSCRKPSLRPERLGELAIGDDPLEMQLAGLGKEFGAVALGMARKPDRAVGRQFG